VVIDSNLQLLPDARLLAGGRALVFAAVDRPPARRQLESRGAEVVLMPNVAGKVDLPAMLLELGRRGINEVLVETGTRLNGSLLREGCIDELLAYIAPSVLGEHSLGMFDLPAMNELAQRGALRFTDVARVGDDLRVLARVERLPGPFSMS
jgi:diaminohydroxyphosphoribosylaminopyrimidine deaminase/5-amino-6-(5-phosphoribosylamino)uracil reductase